MSANDFDSRLAISEPERFEMQARELVRVGLERGWITRSKPPMASENQDQDENQRQRE